MRQFQLRKHEYRANAWKVYGGASPLTPGALWHRFRGIVRRCPLSGTWISAPCFARRADLRWHKTRAAAARRCLNVRRMWAR